MKKKIITYDLSGLYPYVIATDLFSDFVSQEEE